MLLVEVYMLTVFDEVSTSVDFAYSVATAAGVNCINVNNNGVCGRQRYYNQSCSGTALSI